MDLRLDGKVALVTGGSRGIGRAIATSMAESGARVMISSRKAEDLEVTAKEIGHGCEWFAANAGNEDEAAACIAATVERLGGIDILVNNAATNPYMGSILGIDEGRAEQDRAGQPVGRAALDAAGGRGGPRRARGSVGHQHRLGRRHVGGRRHRLVQRHQGGGDPSHEEPGVGDWAPRRGSTRSVPGLVKTDMAKALVDAAGEQMAKRLPMKRLGEPVDIASAADVPRVTTPRQWITGTTLVVVTAAPSSWAAARPVQAWQRRTLPEGVRGSASSSTSSFGGAVGGQRLFDRGARQRRASADWPGRWARRTPRRAGPTRGSGRPATASSATPGMPASARSTAAGHTFSPPVLMTSPMRPSTRQHAVDDRPGVAGGEPPVGVLGVGAVAVAAQQHRAAHVDLALDDAQLDAVERAPVVRDAAAGLGHAVGAHDVGGELAGCRGAAEQHTAKPATSGRGAPSSGRARPAWQSASSSKRERRACVASARSTTDSPPMWASGRHAHHVIGVVTPERAFEAAADAAIASWVKTTRLGFTRGARRRDDQRVAGLDRLIEREGGEHGVARRGGQARVDRRDSVAVVPRRAHRVDERMGRRRRWQSAAARQLA